MAKQSKSRSHLRLVKPGEAPEAALPAAESQFFQEVLDGWKARRCGTLHHTEKAFNRDAAVVRDFVRFTQKAPWRWDEDHFDRWCSELALVRKVAMSTERVYQDAVRRFLKYASENIRFRDECREKFGVPLRQIVTDENCIPHSLEREQDSERRALTHEEAAVFFKAVDAAILEASRFCSKSLRPLQRDKAFFISLYYAGLRISENKDLDINSFLENAAIPEFGSFGRISVWGKGSNGSGPKYRIVVADHPNLPATLQWYHDVVRPALMMSRDPNETAFFLSERGGRVTVGGMEARFQKLLQIAGLDGRGFTPHCLRRSSVTHTSMNTSVGVAKEKAGHAYQATTQGYCDFPSTYMANMVNKSARSLLDRQKRSDPSNDGEEKPDEKK